ncbi:unnamed protein product [Arctogadus glacialis]
MMTPALPHPPLCPPSPHPYPVPHPGRVCRSCLPRVHHCSTSRGSGPSPRGDTGPATFPLTHTAVKMEELALLMMDYQISILKEYSLIGIVPI